MTILDTINAYKYKEITAKKEAIPSKLLENSAYFNRETHSLKKSLKKNSIGIIAEHKRKSPSKSVINDRIDLPNVIEGYTTHGASGISILTDTRFFGGSLTDLSLARTLTELPILRKDFIIDPYQIYEAKAFGADVILLIAASLSRSKIKELSGVAKTLHLEVLVEIHTESELEKCLLDTVDIIGVNNRNLKTFEVTIDYSMQLATKIPTQFMKISESGISDPNTVKKLSKAGFQGYLMGEHFMKTTNPGSALKTFISAIS